MTFADIPESVIDHVRRVFAAANEKVARTLSDHPSMHEEMLDQTLITELTVAPSAFFAGEQAAVVIESHWLGGRRMWGRWEIADIALVVLLRRGGHLVLRKVALLQTKRLYSKEVAVEELGPDDYMIGIGRLGDRTGHAMPLTVQRGFSFDEQSVYGALHAGSKQMDRIDAYEQARHIPVFYAFYNPQTLPFRATYPPLDGAGSVASNLLGTRVQTSAHVHGHLATLPAGAAPSFGGLKDAASSAIGDPFAASGWRLENFVADEVLRCRQGTLFDGSADMNLERLFYARSAPIMAAITITIEVGGGG